MNARRLALVRSWALHLEDRERDVIIEAVELILRMTLYVRLLHACALYVRLLHVSIACVQAVLLMRFLLSYADVVQARLGCGS